MHAIAGRVCATAPDFLSDRTTLDISAQLAVENLADGAVITLARDGGEPEHVTTRHCRRPFAGVDSLAGPVLFFPR